MKIYHDEVEIQENIVNRNIDYIRENMKLYSLNDKYNKKLEENTAFMLLMMKLQNLFKWSNLPDEILQEDLERILQFNGSVLFTKIEDKFYIFKYNCFDKLNEYYRYYKYKVVNEYFYVNKGLIAEFEENKDCITIDNNLFKYSNIRLCKKHIQRINEIDLSLLTLAKTMRSALIFSADNEKTAQSINQFLQNLEEGKVNVINEKAMLTTIKTHDNSYKQNMITELLELMQYTKADMYSNFGININANMKREYVNDSELEISFSHIVLLINNMLECRKKACERINKMYNLNISVDFDYVFKKLDDDLMTTNIINNEKDNLTKVQQKILEGDNFEDEN